MSDEPIEVSPAESDQALFDPSKRTKGDYTHLGIQAVLSGALSFDDHSEDSEDSEDSGE